MREIAQLAKVADQVGKVIALMRQFRDAVRIPGKLGPLWELGEQQRLLATLLSGPPTFSLMQCRAIADPANSRPQGNLDGWHLQATPELKAATAEAAARLAKTSSRATHGWLGSTNFEVPETNPAT
jgi:hypothetical protein